MNSELFANSCLSENTWKTPVVDLPEVERYRVFLKGVKNLSPTPGILLRRATSVCYSFSGRKAGIMLQELNYY